MDDADKYIMRQVIASLIDHPSVYMGGPSQTAVRKAVRIVSAFLDSYDITPRERAAKNAANVRTWRKSPWDSFDRV